MRTWFMIDKAYLWYRDASRSIPRKEKNAFYRTAVKQVLQDAGVYEKTFKTREEAQQAMIENNLCDEKFYIYECSNF